MSNTEPKRIYNWQHSQLSIARHYGGCKVNGVEYIIRYDLEGQPLEEMQMKAKAKKSKSQTPRQELEDLFSQAFAESKAKGENNG